MKTETHMNKNTITCNCTISETASNHIYIYIWMNFYAKTLLISTSKSIHKELSWRNFILRLFAFHKKNNLNMEDLSNET